MEIENKIFTGKYPWIFLQLLSLQGTKLKMKRLYKKFKNIR